MKPTEHPGIGTLSKIMNSIAESLNKLTAAAKRLNTLIQELMNTKIHCNICDRGCTDPLKYIFKCLFLHEYLVTHNGNH